MSTQLTRSQQRAFDELKHFVSVSPGNPHSKKWRKVYPIFILKGYAGTGKTTLMHQLIEYLEDEEIPYHLLASTGRAAKILANATKKSTCTVHGLVYAFRGLNKDMEEMIDEKGLWKTEADKHGQLQLMFHSTTVRYESEYSHIYIVDEASMVSDYPDSTPSQAKFGTGKLLNDLLRYDTKGRFIFVGDACQLPPINSAISPALSVDYFKHTYGKEADEAELTEVMRQADGNSIVHAAERLRKLYANPPMHQTWAKFPLRGFPNVHILSSHSELLNSYRKDIVAHGFNHSTMLCFTNKQSAQATEILRSALGRSGKLQEGDLLLVTQNNLVSGLMNGDLVEVVQVGNTRTIRKCITLREVAVRELFTGNLHTQFLIENVLYGDRTNLTAVEHRELFVDFYLRMKKEGIGQKTGTFNGRMQSDPELNALRAVYGYVLTCHKAQGGEWDTVYIDVPRHMPAQKKPYVYQWMYTAITRAKKEVYLVDDFWIE